MVIEEPQISPEVQEWHNEFQMILESQNQGRYDIEIDSLDQLWTKGKALPPIKGSSQFESLIKIRQEAAELRTWVENLEERKKQIKQEVNTLFAKPKKVHPDVYEQNAKPDYQNFRTRLLELNSKKISRSEFDSRIENIKKLRLQLWKKVKKTFEEELQKPKKADKQSYISLQKNIKASAELIVQQEISDEELDLFIQAKIIYDELSNFNTYLQGKLKDYDLKGFLDSRKEDIEKFPLLTVARELHDKVEKSPVKFSKIVTEPLNTQVKKTVFLSRKIQLEQNEAQDEQHWGEILINTQGTKLRFPELNELRKRYHTYSRSSQNSGWNSARSTMPNSMPTANDERMQNDQISMSGESFEIYDLSDTELV